MEHIYQFVDHINIDPIILFMIYMFSVWPFMAFSLGMTLAEKVCISPSGFAIDSSGNLYLGKDSKIEVYEDSILIRTIPARYRSYAFTIQKDDTILIGTSSVAYVLNLSGDELSKREEMGTETFNKLQRNKKHFQSANGDRYTMQSPFGRTMIVRDGDEVVYKMPVWEYAVKLMLFFSFGSLIIFIPLLAVKWGRVYPNGI